MPQWGTGLLTLLAGLLVFGGLLLALRWTFGTGHHHVAPRIADPDDPTGDGLLSEVSRVPTEAAAQVLRRRLSRAGIRSTVGRVGPGWRLLVFHEDLSSARVVLSRGALE